MVRLRQLIGHLAFVISIVKLSVNKIASLSFNGDIKIWSLTPGVCLKTIETHFGGDRSICLDVLAKNKIVCFSHDYNRCIKIWDIESETQDEKNLLNELSLVHIVKYLN